MQEVVVIYFGVVMLLAVQVVIPVIWSLKISVL